MKHDTGGSAVDRRRVKWEVTEGGAGSDMPARNRIGHTGNWNRPERTSGRGASVAGSALRFTLI